MFILSTKALIVVSVFLISLPAHASRIGEGDFVFTESEDAGRSDRVGRVSMVMPGDRMMIDIGGGVKLAFASKDLAKAEKLDPTQPVLIDGKIAQMTFRPVNSNDKRIRVKFSDTENATKKDGEYSEAVNRINGLKKGGKAKTENGEVGTILLLFSNGQGQIQLENGEKVLASLSSVDGQSQSVAHTQTPICNPDPVRQVHETMETIRNWYFLGRLKGKEDSLEKRLQCRSLGATEVSGHARKINRAPAIIESNRLSGNKRARGAQSQ